MPDVKKHLNKIYDLNFSLIHDINLIKSLGFNYSSHRPEFIEVYENKEILRERIFKAGITEKDIIVGIDESTMKTGIKTKKEFILMILKKNEDK